MIKTSLLVLTTLIFFSRPSFARDYLPALSGGIGEGGRAVIQENQSNYPLKIVLVGDAGVYLSDVNISVKDFTGQVINNTATEGPVLLLDLDPGTYTITATAEGIIKTEKITVGQTGLKTYYIRFPIKN